jgi:predicted dehydrogenase
MKKVRLVVIGLGLIGKVHAKTLKEVPECDLVAVCDADEKGKQVAETVETKYYSNYQEMIEREKPDGAVLAVPNHLHAPVGVECMQRGLHLLVEKPIALTVSDADLLIEAGKKYHKQILVGHMRRFNPVVEATRDMVKGGQLGKLIGATILLTGLQPPDYFNSWKAFKAGGGGPVFMNLIHDVDTLMYICGDVVRIYAEASNKGRNLEVEDTVTAALRLENDVLANIFLSDCVPSTTSWQTTTREKNSFFYTPSNCYHFYGTEASLDFPHLKKWFYPDQSKLGWLHPISGEEIHIVPADPITRELSHFCKVVAGEETPLISGEEGKKTLEVILALKKSAEIGQPIDL